MDINLQYYVYGDFDTIVYAFKTVASIMANHEYSAIITIVSLFAVMVLAFHVRMEASFGAKLDDRVWAKKLIYGTLLYTALIVPTMTVHVYDPYANKYEPVGGVPLGVGLFACGTSIMTKDIVDMVETSSNPILSFDEIGFGDGYELLAASAKVGDIGSYVDPLLAKELDGYIQNCFDQAYANGDITDTDVYHTDDLLNAIKVDYRVFYSDIYTNSNPTGTLTECADVWTDINLRARSLPFTDSVMSTFCSRNGYDVTDASQLTTCKDKFGGMIAAFSQGHTGSSDVKDFIAQMFTARRYIQPGLDSNIYNAVEIAKNWAQAADYVGSNIAQHYIPKLQGMVASILIMSFVVIALFFYANPSEAFMGYIGLWLWLMLWIIIDSFLNSMGQLYAYNIYEEIRDSGGGGLTAMYNIGDRAVQALSMYGGARWIGMGLASVFSVFIFKMQGGSVFAGFTRSIGANYQAAGAHMAGNLESPQAQAKFHNEMYDGATKEMSMAGMKNMSTFNADYGGTQMERTADLTHKQAMADAYGGNWGEAGRSVGGSQAVKDLQQIGYSSGVLKAAAEGGVSIQDMEGAKGFQDSMTKAGLWDELKDGKVSGDDIRKMSQYGLLSDKGRMEAAQAMSKDLGMDYDKVVKDMQTDSGMKSFFSYKQAEALSGRLGTNIQDTYKALSGQSNITLSDAQAKTAGLGSGGTYSMALDKDGHTVFTEGKSGSSRLFTPDAPVHVKYDGKEFDLKNAEIRQSGQDGFTVRGMTDDGRVFSTTATGHWGKGFQNLELTGGTGRFEQGKSGSETFKTFSYHDDKGALHTLNGVTVETRGNGMSVTGTDAQGNKVMMEGLGSIDSHDAAHGSGTGEMWKVSNRSLENYDKTDKSVKYDGSHKTDVSTVYDGSHKTDVSSVYDGSKRTDTSTTVKSGTKIDSVDENVSGNRNITYDVNQTVRREGSDVDLGSNYNNVFQSGLDKSKSQELAHIAYRNAYDNQSSWVTGKDGKRHIDWKAFKANLDSEIRQQTDGMNRTIGGFLSNHKSIDAKTATAVVYGVEGRATTGTPGGGITGTSASIGVYGRAEHGKHFEKGQSYSADEVYRTIQADHSESIKSAMNKDGSINEEKFMQNYSARMRQTAQNYDRVSKLPLDERGSKPEPSQDKKMPADPVSARMKKYK